MFTQHRALLYKQDATTKYCTEKMTESSTHCFFFVVALLCVRFQRHATDGILWILPMRAL